jgi:hypothetical protein
MEQRIIGVLLLNLRPIKPPIRATARTTLRALRSLREELFLSTVRFLTTIDLQETVKVDLFVHEHL